MFRYLILTPVLFLVLAGSTSDLTIYEIQDKWTIQSSQKASYCMATGKTNTGVYIGFAFSTEGWSMSMRGVNTIPGEIHEVSVYIDNKFHSNILGEVPEKSFIFFPDVSGNLIKSLLDNPVFQVSKLEPFKLQEVDGAITAIMNCYLKLHNKFF